MNKVCSKCGIEKDESEFSKRKGVTPYYAECKECKRLRGKVWHSKNKEYKNAKERVRYKTPEAKERRLITRAQWRAANKDRIRVRTASYMRTRRVSDPLFHLSQTVRSSFIKSIKRNGYTKQSKIAHILGCTFEEFMRYLGNKPCDNAHLDHLCPVSQAMNEEEFYKLHSYVNFQWLSPEDNFKKSDSQTEEGLFMCRFLLGREWVDV